MGEDGVVLGVKGGGESMYRGELVRLRGLTKDDMVRAKEYLNDYDVRKTLQDTVPYPYTWRMSLSFLRE